MRIRQAFLLGFFTLSLTFGTLHPSSAELQTPGVAQKVPAPQKDQYVIQFNQSVDGFGGERYSRRVQKPDTSDPGSPLPHYQALLPACKNQFDITCIESVESKKVNEISWKKASLSTTQLDVKRLNLTNQKYFEYTTWPADEASSSIPATKAIPAGGVASSWEMPSTPHSSGSSYMVEVTFLDSYVGLGDGPRFWIKRRK